MPIVQGERRKAKEEAEQVRYLSEKEKNDIHKELVVLQDRLKDKNKALDQQQK